MKRISIIFFIIVFFLCLLASIVAAEKYNGNNPPTIEIIQKNIQKIWKTNGVIQVFGIHKERDGAYLVIANVGALKLLKLESNDWAIEIARSTSDYVIIEK